MAKPWKNMGWFTGLVSWCYQDSANTQTCRIDRWSSYPMVCNGQLGLLGWPGQCPNVSSALCSMMQFISMSGNNQTATSILFNNLHCLHWGHLRFAASEDLGYSICSIVNNLCLSSHFELQKCEWKYWRLVIHNDFQWPWGSPCIGFKEMHHMICLNKGIALESFQSSRQIIIIVMREMKPYYDFAWAMECRAALAADMNSPLLLLSLDYPNWFWLPHDHYISCS